MKKNIALIILLLILTSCNLLHFHNVKNDFKWKNKKLPEKQEIKFMFNPIVVKEFDSSSTLKYFFEDSNKIEEAEKTLRKKLTKRNFELVELDKSKSIVIDSIIFSDETEMIQVLYNDPSEGIMGYFEKNEIKIKVIGHLYLSDNIKSRILSEYQFSQEPREGYIIKGTVAYTNAGINLDKIINNIMNEFSYRCYLAIQENKK
ncbi:hypothetical protein [Psychroserpens algicola]|uniref:hypothetical protein n=1 Tax=Psychroserpens algicola TaxID=1719034 RepID=UPI0019533530|nr:hypothetical protein [Psychroserpens algicola]